MLWNDWEGILRIVIVGTGSYAALLVLQRISGKRTLSKLNAFDLVVTVALGSTLATTILSPDVALTDGVVAFGVLILLQLTVTLVSVRIPGLKRLVKATPTLLLDNGTMLHDVMKRERVSQDEVLQAVRSTGKDSLVGLSVVLETNGKMSVVGRSAREATAMSNVGQSNGRPTAEGT